MNSAIHGCLQQVTSWLWGLGLLVVSCTSARENSENEATVPASINSDADRKAIYNQGTNSNTPSAIPRNLNDQASEINQKKQIEYRGADEPNTRPLEERPEQQGRPHQDSLP